MDRTRYDIDVKRHVFIRATQRGVTPDRIEEVLMSGRLERIGNDRVRFVKEGKKRDIICVGEVRGLRIVIFTIETKVK